MSFRVENLHAFISEDAQGEEGLCAARVGDVVMPMIAASPERLTQLWQWARQLKAAAPQARIKLVRFVRIEEMSEVQLEGWTT